MRNWLFVLGFLLLVLTACDNYSTIRVYIENPASKEINVFKSCEGITVTNTEDKADYIVTTRYIPGSNRYINYPGLFVATADGDFIFSKRGVDLDVLVLEACEAIHSQ